MPLHSARPTLLRPGRGLRASLDLRLVVLLLPFLGCASDEPAGRLSVAPAAVTLRQGTAASVRLTWTPARPLDKVEGEPTVFVHLVHPRDGTVRTFDHRYPRGWEPGVPVEYALDVALSAVGGALDPGEYELGVGLYDPLLGYRWPLITDGEEGDRREYRVVQVTIEAGEGPHFAFSEGWGPVVPGTTEQIVARRWLHGPGSIELSGVRGAGDVLVDLYLGTVPDGGSGAPAISAHLDAACESGSRQPPGAPSPLTAPGISSGPGGDRSSPGDPAATEAQGTGPARLTVPLTAGADAVCTIHVLPAGEGDGGWLQLDGLAWRPAARTPVSGISEGGTTG